MPTKLTLGILGFLSLSACSTPYHTHEHWGEETVVVHRPYVVHTPRVVVEEHVVIPAPKKRVRYVHVNPTPVQPPMKVKQGSPQHPEAQMKVKHGKPYRQLKKAAYEDDEPKTAPSQPGMKVQSGKPPHASQY